MLSQRVVGASRQQLKRIKRHVDVLQRSLGRGRKTTQRTIENTRGVGGKEWEKNVSGMIECKDPDVEKNFGDLLTEGVFEHARA